MVMMVHGGDGAGVSRMIDKLVELAKPLYDSHAMLRTFRETYTVFLCGGAQPEQQLVRNRIRDALEAKRSRYKHKYVYKAYYPEDMFIEVSMGHLNRDMLTLENLLARSVHSVAILLQSPGTFTELGAFANHSELCNKLIVITDERYRRHRSFINAGPITHLEKNTQSAVLYKDLASPNPRDIATAIAEHTRRISAYTTTTKGLLNPTIAHGFYLVLIHQFDPIPRELLLTLAVRLHEEPRDADDLQTVLESSLSFLARAGFASNSPRGLLLTRKGYTHLSVSPSFWHGYLMGPRRLTTSRRDAINALYRRKGYRSYFERSSTA